MVHVSQTRHVEVVDLFQSLPIFVLEKCMHDDLQPLEDDVGVAPRFTVDYAQYLDAAKLRSIPARR